MPTKGTIDWPIPVTSGGPRYVRQRTGSDDEDARSTDHKVELPGGMVRKLQRTISNKTREQAEVISSIGFFEQAKREVKEVLFSSKLNLLLLSLPFAIASDLAGWGNVPTFILSCLGLCSLAERLGFITEQLAMYTNESLGGLLNATFGNATEVILSITLIREDKLRYVQLSLLGSVVSNLLLVLGSAFIAGGIKNQVQYFNEQAVVVNCGLLILSAVAIVLPSLLASTHTELVAQSAEIHLSRFEAIFMFAIYVMFLFFQLKTHKHLYDDDAEPRTPRSPRSNIGGGSQIEMNLVTIHASAPTSNDNPEAGDGDGLLAASDSGDEQAEKKSASDDEEEELVLSKMGCFIWLTVISVGIAVLSEYVSDSISEASDGLHIPRPFVATIILPIVGNAAEHSSAVLFAYKNKIDISLGVAVGSSTQVGMMVMSLVVIIAWIMGHPLTLDLEAFEAVVYFISVLLAIVVIHDGVGNWLKGVMLVFTFILISAGFWFHKDICLESDGPRNVNSTELCG